MVMAPRSHPCLPEGGPWRSFLAWLVTWEQGEQLSVCLWVRGCTVLPNSLTHSLSKLIVDAIVDIESLRCDAVLATGLVDGSHRHWHLCVKVWLWCCKLTLVGCHSSIPPSRTHTHTHTLTSVFKSASSHTTSGSLPPSSSTTGVSDAEAPRITWRPTAGEPVKMTLSTPPDTSAAPVSAKPVTICVCGHKKTDM